MKARSSARAVTAALAATVLVTLAGAVLTGLGWSHLATSDAVGSIDATASAIAYAGLGALIVRRAGNLIGWLMLAEGAAIAIGSVGSAYAIVGMKAHPGALPSPATVGALAESVFVIESNVLAAIFLVFPTGRLPSPRWRPAALAGLGLTGLTLAAFVVSTRQVALPAPGGISLIYPNPLALRSVDPAARLGTLNGLGVVFVLLLAPAVVSLVIRYRRGDQRLRQQMKWLALVVTGFLICQSVGILAVAVGQQDKPLQGVPYTISAFLALLGIPAAMAIAILRYRLFDIDVIISRALLFTLLSAGVTAVYAAIVLGIGTFVGPPEQPAADHRGGGGHRAGVPAAAAAGQPAGQPRWSTATGPRRTRSCPTSPPTWPASSTWATRWTGWCRCWAARPGPAGSRRGSGSAPSCGPARSGRRARCRPRRWS